jgi:catechol 2,3-dioxygenase-like lactoylglutathione lyase family enzyme
VEAGFLSHVDLTVADLGRSVAFYDQVLARIGYKRPPRPRASAPPTWFIFGPQRHFFSMSLFQAKPDGVKRRYDRHAPGLNHLAFHVPSRQHVEDLYAHLCGIGAKILRAPAEYPYTPGYYAVFFADPDGMKLEGFLNRLKMWHGTCVQPVASSDRQGRRVCMGCGLSLEPAAG